MSNHKCQTHEIHSENSWGSLLLTGSTITEKEQLLCKIQNDIIFHDTFMPFHQPGTGRQ